MNETDYTDRPRVGRSEDVVRYVGGSHFDRDTGIVNGSAFDRNPTDTDGLSVNRVGVWATDRKEDRRAMRRVMATRRTPGKTAVFVQVNVGAALDALAEFEEDVFVCHNPLEQEGTKAANPAHALIIGLPFKGETIGSLRSELAGDRLASVISERFPAFVDEEV